MNSDSAQKVEDALDRMFEDVALFSHGMWPERTLRGYQEEVARAIIESVEERLGER